MPPALRNQAPLVLELEALARRNSCRLSRCLFRGRRRAVLRAAPEAPDGEPHPARHQGGARADAGDAPVPGAAHPLARLFEARHGFMVESLGATRQRWHPAEAGHHQVARRSATFYARGAAVPPVDVEDPRWSWWRTSRAAAAFSLDTSGNRCTSAATGQVTGATQGTLAAAILTAGGYDGTQAFSIRCAAAHARDRGRDDRGPQAPQIHRKKGEFYFEC